MTLPLRYPGDFNPRDFIVELLQAATLDEAFAAFERQVQRLGFDGALYTFVPQIYLEASLSLVPLFKTSEAYCPRFLRHYQEAGFEKDDFTVKKITEGERNVLDWWGENRKGCLTPQENTVILTAREEYGILNGMTIPIYEGMPGFGGVSCISSEKDRAYQMLVDERLQALLICVQIFHSHVMVKPRLKEYFLAPLLDQLPPKEKCVLQFLVSGLPMKVLPDHVPGISQKYGEKLLDNIRTKFGGIKRIRLLYLLSALGFDQYL